MKFEKNTQNVCNNHVDDWEIIGTGRHEGVGHEDRFYNAYYCPKCKKVYYEDCEFSKPIRVFYSKRGTKIHLKSITQY